MIITNSDISTYLVVGTIEVDVAVELELLDETLAQLTAALKLTEPIINKYGVNGWPTVTVTGTTADLSRFLERLNS